ncbi:MAG: DUF2834 domain-containing protein [Pseudomonadota bacterium]
MKYFYGIMCVLGLLFPYGVFVPWLVENGINIELFVSEAASTSIGAFAWTDVLVSGVVLIAFILTEGARQQMKRLWLPILGTCTVGVSLGLPLFLLLRELHLERSKS